MKVPNRLLGLSLIFLLKVQQVCLLEAWDAIRSVLEALRNVRNLAVWVLHDDSRAERAPLTASTGPLGTRSVRMPLPPGSHTPREATPVADEAGCRPSSDGVKEILNAARHDQSATLAKWRRQAVRPREEVDRRVEDDVLSSPSGTARRRRQQGRQQRQRCHPEVPSSGAEGAEFWRVLMSRRSALRRERIGRKPAVLRPE